VPDHSPTSDHPSTLLSLLVNIRSCDEIIIIIIASHEDEMNDKYNDKLCTRNEVIQ